MNAYATSDIKSTEAEATDDAEVLTDDDTECKTCGELSDDLPCFECYMEERGHDFFL